MVVSEEADANPIVFMLFGDWLREQNEVDHSKACSMDVQIIGQTILGMFL